MSVHVFGIRHHGPGCARSLRAALEALRPDVIALEGPADAEDALPLAAHDGMQPPVAMLIYPPDEPRRAVYYPLTVFSPEWQTLRWAAANNVPVRLMDLPQSHRLAMDVPTEQTSTDPGDESEDDQTTSAESEPGDASPATTEPDGDDTPSWRTDPIAVLAAAAGYSDHELWWEQQVERRTDATELFTAIHEAMRTVREECGEIREIDLLREAFMRKTLRGVVQEGFQKVAVVCGAWHAPVLDEEALNGNRDGLTPKDDNARLKGLAKVNTSATWIPWTHSRLSYRSGYGAGVESPGWYEHLWTSNDAAPLRWIVNAARLLREKDLDASSASVIEAVRLADALAAMRELRSPGLNELTAAIQAVLCHGETSALQLIRQRLEIGDVLGQVPADSPSVPLALDLAEQQKTLRLKPSTENRLIDLDLRKENDLARSRLLHRLQLLGIPWGGLESTGSRASTFHEVWRIEWKPEFAVAIIEANVWGNTVELAVTAKVIDSGAHTADLPKTTTLLDRSILAGLDAAVDPLLSRIQSMAAVGADVRHLMDALPPLARVSRYGDVRGTKAAHVEPIVVGLFERVVVGLGVACSALDDDAAERMLTSMSHVAEALDVLNRPELAAEWQTCLRRLMEGVFHPLLRGWCCRSLLARGALSDDDLDRMTRLALSTANPPAECAAWTAGLLRGSGLLLLHQDRVWHVFNQWMSSLDETIFVEMLPLLRRAFADFSGPERRQMGEKVRHLQMDARAGGARSTAAAMASTPLDERRARRVLPVLAQILGVEYRDDDH